MRKSLLAGLALLSNMIMAADFDGVVFITEEWPPYNYYESGEIKGFSYDIVSHMIDDLKIDTEIKILPEIKVKRILEGNSKFVFFSLFRTAKREKKYNWIAPIDTGKLCFYKKKGSNLDIKTLDDAKKVKRIATRNSGLVYDYLVNEGFNNLDTTGNEASKYLKVVMGRNDLAIGEPELGIHHFLRINHQPVDSLESTGVYVFQDDLYIAGSLNLSNKEVKLLKDSFSKIMELGIYDKLYEKYMK